jgi:hypothetical protein
MTEHYEILHYHDDPAIDELVKAVKVLAEFARKYKNRPMPVVDACCVADEWELVEGV